MRKTIQILLFIISYAPLYLILFFQNLDDKIYNQEGIFLGFRAVINNNLASLSFLILIIVSISLYFLLFKIVLKSSTIKLKVEKIQDNCSEHLSYLATYILPFVGLKFDNWQNILSTIGLFYVLGHIYIKTNLILTNPTLTFFGYKISKINFDQEEAQFIIHKKDLQKGSDINCVHLIQKIYIVK